MVTIESCFVTVIPSILLAALQLSTVIRGLRARENRHSVSDLAINCPAYACRQAGSKEGRRSLMASEWQQTSSRGILPLSQHHIPHSPECVEGESSEVAPHIPRPMEQLSANLAASASRSTILLRRPWSVLPILPRPGPMKLTTRR